MNILTIVIIIFIVLEISNIIMLYFTPGTKMGNGVGVFNAYEKSKDYPEIYALVKYLINWVAGTKLIFILLLVVIIITGDNTTKLYSVGALIISIATFFWRLYPAIRKMDNAGQINPKGYSKTLMFMIAGFLGMFITAVLVYLFVIN